MDQDTYCNNNGYEVADLYLELAKTLYEAGASVERVSDSVRWLAENLSDSNVHVFVGYEEIELSIQHRDKIENRLYVLREPFKVNIAALHQVSLLMHNLSSYQGDICAIRNEICRIQNLKRIYPIPLTILFTSIACAAFGWLNHSDVQALFIILISAFCALSIKFGFGSRLHNLYLSTLFSAFSGGIIAALLTRVIQTQTSGVALISSILFLIPGFLTINGGLDIIRDHTSCGIVRLTSAFIQVSIISGSLIIPLSILGDEVLSNGSDMNMFLLIFTMCLASGLAALGFALLFNAPLLVLPGCMICAIVGRLVREAGVFYQLDIFLCIFSGMVAATLLATYYGRKTKVPGVFLAVIAGIPMIPGLAMIKGLQEMFIIAHTDLVVSNTVVIHSLQYIMYSAVAVLALICGIILPTILIYRKSLRI
ncbi:threonine/serine ThrE exporter family protein [Methanoplanus endosymbiosus]|uniref:Threonine/serine exporter family protein n=1 Tax=Methanoplanus endosymbiosus TaxID=33865 RepID=A0A9E7PP87_9EURY|nr:threonine/serine exporter family protein [Methanoplanus endosymbiosus]UUX92544.1 threonine/serine exporter family protein [Methanoplanus endosymbiosus]